ncbi:glycoside hydrolase [Dacryopinax primogenitus]|uniref:Beta-mannosidase B n=1 Tax=Dacryopinax primogenitus (strain DJM 731) TaxID=1858805 RepID=M5FN87_DACPD|nr:glycoside hydrolase [Dacryopinax primogenitus]EJT97015.1 glycoside hydrolase [Dacryopinax primogenitus]
MPSDVYAELTLAGAIPHPYKKWNEHQVQWIGDREWVYSCQFALEGGELKQGENADLVFEGLDTYCDVYLNGEMVLKADNMFRPWRVPLKASQLEPTNHLLLHFKSSRAIALALEAQYGKRTAGSCNVGHESRVYVRKAQYHWRWDWGPELMSVGPWLPVRLERYWLRLSEVQTKARVNETNVPSLGLSLELAGNVGGKVHVEVVLRDVKGKEIKSEKIDATSTEQLIDVINWELKGQVDLWWPVGYGSQPLYTVGVILTDESGTILDQLTQKIGFRRIALIQEPLSDQPGTTFLFEVNGVRMFIGGSCWVPIDNMLTLATPERYRTWLELMVRGNQNMVRIWGGGIYESDEFYDACDELGLLVWQDFMFACGQYPAYEEFLDQVRPEAELAVKRLRHHASLALLCGNNEDYQQVKQWGITELPAVVIYEQILPQVVTALTSPEIPYHRGSPWGGADYWNTADPTMGDIHQWEMWAGRADFYQNWDLNGGRFVSEFGLPAMPHPETIDWFFDDEKGDRYPQSRMMQQHNKAGSHERRLAIYMNENFRITGDFESYVFLTRMMQSEGVGAAYRMWRRDWKGPGKQYNAGALVWQINNSWPVTSWATCDYFQRPKPTFYATAREMLPITVGIKRTVKKNKENDRPRQFYEFGAFQSLSATMEIWGCNSTLHPRVVVLEVMYWDLESNWRASEYHTFTLLPNQSTDLLQKEVPHRPRGEPDTYPGGDPKPTLSASIIVSARLVDVESKEILSRYVDWPQPFKLIDFPDPILSVRVDGDEVKVDVRHPVKGLWLDVAGETDTVQWSDNAIDVVPGDPQTLKATGLNGRALVAQYLGKEKASAI